MAASGAKPEAADLERSFRKAPLAAVRTKANLTAGSDPKRTFESGLCALNARVPGVIVFFPGRVIVTSSARLLSGFWSCRVLIILRGGLRC